MRTRALPILTMHGGAGLPEGVSKKEYLTTLAKELHKPVKHKYPTRKVFVNRKDQTWSIDLVDMSTWKEENKGYTFILTIVDVFTRWAAAVPLKSKSADVVLAALKHVVEESKRKPERLWADAGTEFVNAKMRAWMKANAIELYHTYGPHKSAIVERFNRTLKTNMWRELTATNTHDWVPLLPQLLADYNKTKHRTLGMSPNEASADPEKAQLVWAEMQADEKQTKKPAFKVGDWVRISRTKGAFEKGFDVGWSREQYKIKEVMQTIPITYHIADYNGETIKGSFYTEEMQKVKYPDTYLVEKVIKERGVGAKKELFVKWLGYSDKDNSWIKASEAEDV